MKHMSPSLQLWEVLKNLEEYIRHDIVHQMNGATSFGEDDMVPLKDAHLTCEKLKPMLSPTLYIGSQKAIQVALTGLNGMLDAMRQALFAPPPLRQEQLRSACDSTRRQTLDQYRLSLAALEPLIRKEKMPVDNTTATTSLLRLMPEKTRSVSHVRAAEPLLLLISVLGAFLGAILLLGGIYLAVSGSSADTKFSLFGNEFSSTSIGVSMTAIGTVLCVLTFRRVLSTIDKLAALPADDDRPPK